MSAPEKKIYKISVPQDTYEIIPQRLYDGTYLATLPTLTTDSVLALQSDLPGTKVIPATSTANKLLVSTTTNGTAKWSDWSTAGYLKTNSSGVISIESSIDADKVDNMHMLDQTYAYKEKLTISEGCVASIVHTGLTEAEIFALTGNRYGQLYLASDTNKYWRRKDTQTEAASSHWRNDTTAATAANALPNQLTTEDAIYIKLDTKTKYYSKLPKFFVEASYDNINGSTAITGFCRMANQFDITACAYNGNNLVGIYQPSGNTDIYYFKFARFRSIYGASSQCSVSQTIYTNFSTNGATLTFIDVNSPEYATVSGYLYISVPTFGEDRTAINGSLLPRENQLRNLGSYTLQWNNIYGKQIYENGEALSNKYQAALSTQTAYSAKGSATKVPQITTNNLGQVTGITEVTITDNNDNQTVKVGSTTFTASAAISFTGSGAASVSATSSNNTITITVPSIGTASGTIAAGDHTHGYYTKPATGIPAEDLHETYIQTSATGSTANKIPVLDSNGKLPESTIPAVAITDTYVVASASAMTALAAQKGDIAIRSDLNKSFVLQATPASTLENWKELLTPTDAVLSVNNKTGVVTLNATDVGALPDSTYLGQQIIVLEDNGSTTAGIWLAKTSAITALAAGQIFLYRVTVAGSTTTKLNITCSGTAAGAKNIYRVGTTKLTTQYPVGEYIMLYFDGTYFKVFNDYDANSDTKVRQYQKGGTSTLTNNQFPLLAKYVNTATDTYVASYANYWNDTYLDTSTGELYVNNDRVVTTALLPNVKRYI